MREPIKPYFIPWSHFSNIPQNIKEFGRWIKSFFLRGMYGWAPCDTWSFDTYLAKVMSEGLAYLSTNSRGYPSDYTENEWSEKLSYWSTILYKYQKLNDDEDPSLGHEFEVTKETVSVIKELADNWTKLWD